jgi:protein-tyrosine phosphatase
MIPFADLHCHLLAGLDDGPGTDDDALEMCRIAYAEGVRTVAALAHQNERWSSVTPEAIRQSTCQLRNQLAAAGLDLTVFPAAEVMVASHTQAALAEGRLLTIADRKQFLLIEMPHGITLDIRPLVKWLRQQGIRPVIAHPERCPEFLHDEGRIEELIQHGCLVQVSSHSVTHPKTSADRRAIKSWFRRGIAHVMGSDGHSPTARAPRMAEAYRLVCRWAGATAADRVFSTNGTALLHGLPLRVPLPEPRRIGWLSRIWR